LRRGQKGQIEYCCRVLKSEARDPVALVGADPVTAQSRIKMCGWCDKISVQVGIWLEPADALAAFGIFSADEYPVVANTLYRACAAAMIASTDLEQLTVMTPVANRPKIAGAVRRG